MNQKTIKLIKRWHKDVRKHGRLERITTMWKNMDDKTKALFRKRMKREVEKAIKEMKELKEKELANDNNRKNDS